MKKGYEIILEDVETKDVVKYFLKRTEEAAKKCYLQNMMKYRVIINKFDEEYGTSTNVIDNCGYWVAIGKWKY